MTDTEACSIVGVLTPLDALHVARFRQLAQIVEGRSRFIWANLVAEQDWLDAAAEAVERVRSITGQDFFPRIPRDACDKLLWIDQVSVQPSAYKALLRKFCRLCIQRARDVADSVLDRARVMLRLECQGALVLSMPDTKQVSRATAASCNLCGDEFADARALAVHKSLRHGVTSEASLAAFGTTCESCCKQFWPRSRARAHFHRSAVCRAIHVQADCGSPPFEKEQPKEWRPVTRLCGPQPWWATLLPEARAEVAVEVAAVCDLGTRIQKVSNASDGQALRVCWRRCLQGETEDEIAEQFESVCVGALAGISGQVLAAAAHIARYEALLVLGQTVIQRGHTLIVIPRDVAAKARSEELSLLSQ